MSTGTTTTTGRKVRGDAKLERLSAEQQECLRYWLEEENYPYRQIVELVRTKFGVAVGKSAVGAYYQRHILPERHDDDTDAAAFLATLPAGQFDAATVKHAKALAFNALARPQPQIQTASRLLDLVHRVHKQEIAEKRLALEQRRVALREALAHPPRRPRAGTAEERTLNAPSPSVHLHDPTPPPPPPTLPPAPPDSAFSTSVPSTPPPCPPCPNPTDSPPLLPPAIPISSLPSVPSLSQKNQPNPPRIPGYSDIVSPPAAPHPTKTDAGPDPSTFSAPDSTPPLVSQTAPTASRAARLPT